jgi:hypothetical protein
MVALRIRSYLPNPRIWKATVTARLCGVEVRGAPPGELSQWLWDFEARPIRDVPTEILAAATREGRIGFSDRKLYKIPALLEAQPPAAFSPDGRTGIFEIGQKRFRVYGRAAYESSRIDGFHDASLVFARDGQLYLLALSRGAVTRELHARMQESFVTYLSGIEQALAPQRPFLVDDDVTLANICSVAELCLFHNERARGSALEAAGLVSCSTTGSPRHIRGLHTISYASSGIRHSPRMWTATSTRSSKLLFPANRHRRKRMPSCQCERRASWTSSRSLPSSLRGRWVPNIQE